MIKRLIWFWKIDRIGPDILSTHFLLFFPNLGRWLCRKKMKHFGEGSEFRPYAYAYCTRNISIGNNVAIRPGTILAATPDPAGSITIEDDVAIGSGVHVYCANHRHNRKDIPISQQGHLPPEPITIKRGAWIGGNVIILPGVEIGENAVVGAGAVFTKSIPAFSIAVGVPAKVIKKIDE